MRFEPITATEARGDSKPMRLACLDKLATFGLAILRNAQRTGTPHKPLSVDVANDAWMATRSVWGGRTVDLSALQNVSWQHGYAVSTGGDTSTGVHGSVSPVASYGEFVAVLTRIANRVPLGQYLGVFYDADEDRIDIDSVYLTTDRDVAISVGVACHSIGGAYDFATGDALWMPHLG